MRSWSGEATARRLLGQERRNQPVVTDFDTPVNVTVSAIRDRERWAWTGSLRADARNDGDLGGRYIALDALNGNPYPPAGVEGRRAFSHLISQ